MQCATPDCPNDAPLVRYESGGSYQRKYCDDHVSAGRLINRHNLGIERRKSNKGYIFLRCEIDGKTTWVGEHRVIAEEILGRPLCKGEQIIHLNDIKSDNRPENLGLRTTVPLVQWQQWESSPMQTAIASEDS